MGEAHNFEFPRVGNLFSSFYLMSRGHVARKAEKIKKQINTNIQSRNSYKN